MRPWPHSMCRASHANAIWPPRPLPLGGSLSTCMLLLVATPLCLRSQGHLAPRPLSLQLGLRGGRNLRLLLVHVLWSPPRGEENRGRNGDPQLCLDPPPAPTQPRPHTLSRSSSYRGPHSTVLSIPLKTGLLFITGSICWPAVCPNPQP